jgi:hypothetical protein
MRLCPGRGGAVVARHPTPKRCIDEERRSFDGFTGFHPMMEKGSESHRFMRCGRALILLSLALICAPQPATTGEKPADKLGDSWPTTVQARYSLRYNGIEVGNLSINSKSTGSSYSLTGSAKVSVLFGTFKALGSSSVSGVIERGAPVPVAYSFDWEQNKKKGTTLIGFKDHVASDIAITPKPRVKPDMVPLTPAHRVGAFDPLSAVLMLTKADSRPPCDRRVGIFDGKNRYDIVLTPKRTMRLPASSSGGPAETGYVCRIMYEPIAGHRDNEDTRSYASNRDAEITLRRIPGSEMLIPYSVTIPTTWGNGTMVTERIDIITAAAGKIALTN